MAPPRRGSSSLDGERTLNELRHSIVDACVPVRRIRQGRSEKSIPIYGDEEDLLMSHVERTPEAPALRGEERSERSRPTGS